MYGFESNFSHVGGKQLHYLRDTIYDALAGYYDTTDRQITFRYVTAAELNPTPGSPFTAMSIPTCIHLGNRAIGDLNVIAFKPGDGTGGEDTFTLSQVDTGVWPRSSGLIPSRAYNAGGETLHLTIASFPTYTERDPVMFAGNLAVLGMHDGALRLLGHAGQPTEDFQGAMSMSRSEVIDPTVTNIGNTPHALYDQHPTFAQICAIASLHDLSHDTALARDAQQALAMLRTGGGYPLAR